MNENNISLSKIKDLNVINKQKYSIIQCLTLLFDKRLAAGFLSGIIKIFNLQTNICELIIKEHNTKILSLVQLNDSNIATSSEDGSIIVISVSKDHYKLVKKMRIYSEKGLYKLVLLRNNKFACYSIDGYIEILESIYPYNTIKKLRETDGQHEENYMNEYFEIYSIIQLKDRDQLISVNLKIVDDNLGDMASNLELKYHINFWDLTSNKIIKKIFLDGIYKENKNLLEVNNKLLVNEVGFLEVIDIKSYQIISKIYFPNEYDNFCFMYLNNNIILYSFHKKYYKEIEKNEKKYKTIDFYELNLRSCLFKLIRKDAQDRNINSLIKIDDNIFCSGGKDGLIKTYNYYYG